MLFYTTFAIRTFTVSRNELFENYTGRHTHVYSGRMTRLKYPPCFSFQFTCYWSRDQRGLADHSYTTLALSTLDLEIGHDG